MGIDEKLFEVQKLIQKQTSHAIDNKDAIKVAASLLIVDTLEKLLRENKANTAAIKGLKAAINEGNREIGDIPRKLKESKKSFKIKFRLGRWFLAADNKHDWL